MSSTQPDATVSERTDPRQIAEELGRRLSGSFGGDSDRAFQWVEGVEWRIQSGLDTQAGPAVRNPLGIIRRFGGSIDDYREEFVRGYCAGRADVTSKRWPSDDSRSGR